MSERIRKGESVDLLNDGSERLKTRLSSKREFFVGKNRGVRRLVVSSFCLHLLFSFVVFVVSVQFVVRFVVRK